MPEMPMYATMHVNFYLWIASLSANPRAYSYSNHEDKDAQLLLGREDLPIRVI